MKYERLDDLMRKWDKWRRDGINDEVMEKKNDDLRIKKIEREFKIIPSDQLKKKGDEGKQMTV